MYLKLENLQVTGSFKPRGPVNRLQALTPAERRRGVAAATAGTSRVESDLTRTAMVLNSLAQPSTCRKLGSCLIS
ncbi:MAG: hypothetical protein L0Z62_01225, partial [Gemmataceae bacterium]|nr:hypothetical protein [Gemmataceae bacterium]